MVKHVLLVVHGAHGCVCFGLTGKTHEAEAAAAVGVAVLDNDLLFVNASSYARREGRPHDR